MNKFLRKFIFVNLEDYSPRKFIFLSFLFACVVALIDGIIDYIFIFENESFLNVLFFNAGTHEIYMRSMIVITFTLFGYLTSLFISRIKSDQKLLIESEIKFRTIANYSRDWIYWITKDNKFNYMSPSCYDITGYSIQEFIDNPNLLSHIVYEEDKEIFLNHDKTWRKDRKIDEAVFRIVTKDGKIKWIYHLCQPVIVQNRYLGSRVSNRDITKLKDAELKLAKLAEKQERTNKFLQDILHQRTIEINTFLTQCPYPRAVFDGEGNITSKNPAWVMEFGDNDDIQNIFNHPVVIENNLKEEFKKVFNTGDKFKSTPIYTDKYDKMIVFDLYSIKNRKGNIEKVVLNIEDVTDHLKSLELSKEIENRNYLIGDIFEFLDIERKKISKELHDRIGQNLMLIKMNAELIKDANLYAPEKSDDIINLTLETSKAIKEIIHSLYPEELEKYGLKDSLIKSINQISKIADFSVVLNISGQYIPFSKNKELAVLRVIQESLNNAIKHSDGKNILVDIRFSNMLFYAKISDDGKGFDKIDNKQHHFGLKFMEERVEIIGGYFEMISERGKGTSIFIEIPID